MFVTTVHFLPPWWAPPIVADPLRLEILAAFLRMLMQALTHASRNVPDARVVHPVMASR